MGIDLQQTDIDHPLSLTHLQDDLIEGTMKIFLERSTLLVTNQTIDRISLLWEKSIDESPSYYDVTTTSTTTHPTSAKKTADQKLINTADAKLSSRNNNNDNNNNNNSLSKSYQQDHDNDQEEEEEEEGTLLDPSSSLTIAPSKQLVKLPTAQQQQQQSINNNNNNVDTSLTSSMEFKRFKNQHNMMKKRIYDDEKQYDQEEKDRGFKQSYYHTKSSLEGFYTTIQDQKSLTDDELSNKRKELESLSASDSEGARYAYYCYYYYYYV
jgi:hypothetical protein